MLTESTNFPSSLDTSVSTPQQQATQQAAAPAGPDLEAIQKQVSTHLNRMLLFRRPYDPARFTWFRQYISQRDQKFFPDGITPRANTFVPYGYSNVETVVSRTMDAFFAIKPFFEANGRGQDDEKAAEKMQIVLDYKLHRANFTQPVEALIRNISIYGHSALYVAWDWGFDVVTGPVPQYAMVPILDPETSQPVMDPTNPSAPLLTPMINPVTGEKVQIGVQMQTQMVPRKRPKLFAIDPYDLLVDPDGGMSAFIQERTYGEMKRENAAYQAATGKPMYFPEAMATLEGKVASDADPDSVLVRIAEFWNEKDNTFAMMTFADDRDAIGWKDMRYAARTGSAYSPYKRKVYAGANLLLNYGDNPYAHRHCPILHTSYVKLPNEVYGIGVIESGADLNEALNSQVSMIRDNWNLGVNHRYLYDTTVDLDHDSLNNANVPGGKIGVTGDPNRAIMPLPTFTPNAQDYQILDLYKGMIELSTGISDFYNKGVGSAPGNDTATGISSIINESNFRFRMFIRNLELDVMQPMLEMCASMVQQYMTDQEEVMITDAPPGIPKYMQVAPEELMGTIAFQLVAANYATNEVVRQRNLMALAGVLSQSPYINEYEAIKLMLKTFKIPEYAQLLKTPQQVQMEQEAQMQNQLQMMVLEHKMNLETISAGGQAKADAQASKDGKGGKSGGKGGRPNRPMQPEGQIPGAGATSATRDVAQNNGLNAMGLSGMGEVANG